MTKKTHAFKAFDKPIAIFRVGDHVDSSGQKISITKNDLEQMVSNYRADSHPYVVGHPEADHPAYGWSAGFFVEDDTLFTDHENVQPEFEEAVDSGLFRNRSVSIAKDENDKWFVKHIGFLGAAAPAVKGLQNLSFSEDDAPLHTFEFADSDLNSVMRSQGWAMRSLERIARGFREYLIERNGVEEADKVMPAYELDSITDAANKSLEHANEHSAHMYSSPKLQNNTEVSMTKTKDKNAPNESGATFTEADVATREAAAAEKAEKAAEAKFEHKQACKDFANKLEDEGKILPNQIPAVVRFMESQSNELELTFTEGEGDEQTETTVSQFAQAQALFSALKDNYSHLKREECRNEDEGDAGDKDAASLVKLANKFQASQLQAGVTVSFSEALEHVTAEAA